jgi:hypothetical protein
MENVKKPLDAINNLNLPQIEICPREKEHTKDWILFMSCFSKFVLKDPFRPLNISCNMKDPFRPISCNIKLKKKTKLRGVYTDRATDACRQS